MNGAGFDYTQDFKGTDFRRHSGLCRIGKGFPFFANPDGLPPGSHEG
jgi:hypothetical protein